MGIYNVIVKREWEDGRIDFMQPSNCFAMPYYIDNISLNVYSLEELCYYIENHLYLIEADFYE